MIIIPLREASSGSWIAWRKLYSLSCKRIPRNICFAVWYTLRWNCEGWFWDKNSLRHVYGTEIINQGRDYILETFEDEIDNVLDHIVDV
ncbi:hypothetical protein CDAR_16121 [Caerostris darwini]|uniref:Uncharacterized protein n=1 Tax=Caerostris darwini TaxID=1538125 RepID=A0AAV4UTV1_9ARAC|nr:hypothetical protein CDAR_16121 [Caerostris darwini]